jgi:hypothetical protein
LHANEWRGMPLLILPTMSYLLSGMTRQPPDKDKPKYVAVFPVGQKFV